MTDNARLLADMFEGRSPGPAFECHSDLGLRPWHPPLDQVWRTQGQGMPGDDPERVAEVWAVLQRLHRDYVAARSRQ